MNRIEKLETDNWNLWVECEAAERELDELSEQFVPVMKVDEDGNREWWLNGGLHREDGPAFECANGRRQWWLNGKWHREDGPAVELENGTRQWYLNDQRHREVEPAYEYADGSREWWLNGGLHREDGPAIEWVEGTREWWLKGKQLSKEAYKEVMELLDGTK